MEKKTVKLKNLYSGEIVFTENFQDVRRVNDIEFIEVWHPETPQRKYLVNKNAFSLVTK